MPRLIAIVGLLILTSGVVQAAAPPALLLIDAERLADVKARLKR